MANLPWQPLIRPYPMHSARWTILSDNMVAGTVSNVPLTVAVDANNESVHATGPMVWRERIASMKVLAST